MLEPFYKRTAHVPQVPVVSGSSTAVEKQSTHILLYDYASRITKKPFGIHVAPQDSPVKPERFRGFHTGIDLELREEELDMEMPVCAMCDGEVAVAQRVSGYGGVVVQRCVLPQYGPVTVLYGHLMLGQELTDMRGSTVAKGEQIGILGTGFSTNTAGERKHLHLAIHKGTGITYAGYVDTEDKLSQWIDPCLVLACDKK